MKKSHSSIKEFELDQAFYKVHKEALVISDFGLDNSNELIEAGFGLYSTVGLKTDVGPIKTDYFRIGFVLSGHINFDIGLESFRPCPNHIVFGFPGQTFSLYNPSKDFKAYYMLFKESFITEPGLMKTKKERYPFLDYTGIQSFELSIEDAREIKDCILAINDEIQKRKSGFSKIIRLYIQLIFVYAGRSYEQLPLTKLETAATGNVLFSKFVKLVGQHFLSLRKVADYAKLLHISSDHLNRTIKSQSAKTAHELINDMIIIEAKAQLLHTQLSIAEIAYQLDFSDPSHFNKFFKKHSGCTPLQFRIKS